MLRYASYDIVFREIPGEVTLALNLSGCPNHCRGCHSPHLQDDAGEALTENVLRGLLDAYAGAVTCLCFMGGDGDPREVMQLAALARKHTAGSLKTAWYSGRTRLFDGATACFDYIKLGPYVEPLGGLDAPTTNQRLYRVDHGKMTDITASLRTSVR
ncbi:MAG: anaerobic ribonucleoside-triphosphate reductase activating protein [Tannerella sp.]|jgi:anaerobic ribonucleoside-triphosphate reductase activating protein|nr:anaerobic ribonucleoside-triphosphate reductase activating protein [Tannerella sp.]